MAHKNTGKQYVLKKVRLSRLNDWQRNASHTEKDLGMILSSGDWLKHDHDACLGLCFLGARNGTTADLHCTDAFIQAASVR